MAAVEITPEAVPHSMAGYNLTDSADFTTLVAGAGNGIKFAWAGDLVVILKNDTGGAAVFTLKVRTVTPYTTYSASVANVSRSVATGKTYLMRLDDPPFKAADGYVTIECDVAGKVLVLDP